MTPRRAAADSLATALEQLRRGSKPAALVAMLTAWRAVRSPELAELIDVLSHQLEAERPPPVLGGSNKQRAWTEALATATLADLPRIYAALIDTQVGLAHARLEQLRDKPADPRLARFLWTWLRDVPFPGPAARRFYIEVTGQLSALADSRFDAEILASRDGDHNTGHYTIARLSGVGARTAARAFFALATEVETRVPVVVVDALAKQITTLAEVLARTGAVIEADERTEAALLAAVHADPAHDEPRLVFADFLQRRGDPRGEFIVLQCFRRASGAKPTPRERVLLKRYASGWTDGLAPFLLAGGREFQRGFLVACRFFHDEVEPDPLVCDAWATIEALDLGAHPFESRLVELITHPRMSQLRALKGLAPTDFTALCHHDRALPIETIHLRWGQGAEIDRALAECRSLPRLRVLDLSVCSGVVSVAERIAARHPGLRVITQS